MSNWINEKAEEYSAKKELEENKEYKMLHSEYWTEVRVQIEKDVAEINNHPVWKKALGISPIEVTQTHGGFKITKQKLPEVTIFVEHDFEKTITVNTEIKRKSESERKPQTEILKLNSDGVKVYLKLPERRRSLHSQRNRKIYLNADN